MTTVSRILELALKDAGVTGEGDSASAETWQDTFDTLKMMVEQWQTNGLMIYAQTSFNFDSTGAVSYSIGPTGVVVRTRPSQVDGAFWRLNSVDFPLKVIQSFEEYQNLTLKTLGGNPALVCYVPDYPNGTLYVWPQPTSGTFYLTTSSPLPTYVDTTDDLSVPGEYEMALRFSLAEILPAVFHLPLRPDLAALARSARKVLKRNNVHIPELGMPKALRRRVFNIQLG